MTEHRDVRGGTYSGGRRILRTRGTCQIRKKAPGTVGSCFREALPRVDRKCRSAMTESSHRDPSGIPVDPRAVLPAATTAELNG